jgi:hypothetical protein
MVTSIRHGETSPAPERAGQPAQAGHPAPQNAALWLLNKTATLQLDAIHIGGYRVPLLGPSAAVT